MENWYYMSNRQRRRILRRRIHSACNIIIGICLFMAVGIMGSVDAEEITLMGFIFHETINIGAILAALWVKANV